MGCGAADADDPELPLQGQSAVQDRRTSVCRARRGVRRSDRVLQRLQTEPVGSSDVGAGLVADRTVPVGADDVHPFLEETQLDIALAHRLHGGDLQWHGGDRLYRGRPDASGSGVDSASGFVDCHIRVRPASRSFDSAEPVFKSDNCLRLDLHPDLLLLLAGTSRYGWILRSGRHRIINGRLRRRLRLHGHDPHRPPDRPLLLSDFGLVEGGVEESPGCGCYRII